MVIAYGSFNVTSKGAKKKEEEKKKNYTGVSAPKPQAQKENNAPTKSNPRQVNQQISVQPMIAPKTNITPLKAPTPDYTFKGTNYSGIKNVDENKFKSNVKYFNVNDYEKFANNKEGFKDPLKGDKLIESLNKQRTNYQNILKTIDSAKKEGKSIPLEHYDTMIKDSKLNFINEKEISNYLKIQKNLGQKDADNYIRVLNRDVLTKRAKEDFIKLSSQDKNSENYGRKIGTSFRAGVEGYVQGQKQNLTPRGQTLDSTAYQDINQTNIENEKNYLARIGLQSSEVVGNMVIPILTAQGFGLSGLDALGRVAGATAIGTSARGNAYNSALKEGYSEQQASTYALATGIAEAGTEYVLGGLAGIGGKGALGKASEKIFPMLQGKVAQTVSNILEKPATSFMYGKVMSMGNEVIEEYVQNKIGTALRNAVFDGNNKIKAFDQEDLDTVLVTLITAGFLGSGKNDISELRTKQGYENMQKAYPGLIKTDYEETMQAFRNIGFDERQAFTLSNNMAKDTMENNVNTNNNQATVSENKPINNTVDVNMQKETKQANNTNTVAQKTVENTRQQANIQDTQAKDNKTNLKDKINNAKTKSSGTKVFSDELIKKISSNKNFEIVKTKTLEELKINSPSFYDKIEKNIKNKYENISESELQNKAMNIMYPSVLKNDNLLKNIIKSNPSLSSEIVNFIEESGVDNPEIIKIKSKLNGDFDNKKTEPKILTTEESVKNTKEFKKKSGSVFKDLVRNISNDADIIERNAPKKTRESAKDLVNNIRSAKAISDAAILTAQPNFEGAKVGKSLNNIFSTINKDNEANFYDYLALKLELERRPQKKSFYSSDTDDNIKQKINTYEKNNPKFKDTSKELYQFLDNNLKYQKNIIGEELYNKLRSVYPSYVPIFENEGSIAPNKLKDNILKTKSTVKDAKMNYNSILPIKQAIEMQTQTAIKNTQANVLLNYIKDNIDSYSNDVVLLDNVKSKIQANDIDALNKLDLFDKNNELIGYDNGEKFTLRVSDDMYKSFESLLGRSNAGIMQPALDSAKGINKIFRGVITDYNPVFAVTNAIRDFGDALFNTRDNTLNYLKNYGKSVKQVIFNLDNKTLPYYQEIFAINGANNTITNYAQLSKKLKGVKLFENISQSIEAAPRFAEFLSYLEKNGIDLSKEQQIPKEMISRAIRYADEITVNFKRGGTIAKALNRSWMPYTNAQIQAFDRQLSRLMGKDGSKAFKGMLVRAMAWGITYSQINELLNYGDEEYKGLSQRDKDNYIIFKVDGKFYKIPKARIGASLGSIISGIIRTIKKEEDPFKGVGTSVTSNMSPVPTSLGLIQGIVDVARNKTWYGNDLVDYRLDKKPKNEQFDTGTSEISKNIANVTKKFGNVVGFSDFEGFSPKKLDYIINQYGGFYGKLATGLTNKKQNKIPILSNFQLDPAYSSDASDKFYAKSEKYRKQADKGDVNSTIISSAMSNVNKEVSAKYEEIKKLEESTRFLSKDNKKIYEQISEKKKEINNLYSNFNSKEKEFKQALENANITDPKDYYNINKIEQKIFGSDFVIKQLSTYTQNKAQLLSKAGVNSDKFFNYYQDLYQIKKSTGDKKGKIINAIDNYNISDAEKMMLIYANNYTIQNGEFKDYSKADARYTVKDYVDKQNMTLKEKTELYKLLGYSKPNIYGGSKSYKRSSKGGRRRTGGRRSSSKKTTSIKAPKPKKVSIKQTKQAKPIKFSAPPVRKKKQNYLDYDFFARLDKKNKSITDTLKKVGTYGKL